MKTKSVNIFGVTGGIGYCFFKEIVTSKMDICGFYYNYRNLANKIKKEHPEVILKRVDLSKNFSLRKIIIPNYEWLFYVSGMPHFSRNIFDFSDKELKAQINININSLFLILQRICSYDSVALRKVVVVTSELPLQINSLYHTAKHLQYKLLEILQPALNEKKIGLSLVKVGWVNTKMYKKYVKATGKTATGVIEPNVVAKCCLEEFNQGQMFNSREIKL